MVDISGPEPIYDTEKHIHRILDGPEKSHKPVKNQRPLGQILQENLEDLDPLSKRAVLWRKWGVDPDRVRSIMLDKNHFEWHLRGTRDLPQFRHKETWGARDAALMHELMIPYLADERGSFIFNTIKWVPEVVIHRWLKNINEAEGSNLSPADIHTGGFGPELALWGLYPSTSDLAADLGQRWASNTFLLSLADTAFADVLHSMTESAPHEPIHPDELIRPNGALFFRTPVTHSSFVGSDDIGIDEEVKPARGISWFSDTERLYVMLLDDAGPWQYADTEIDDRLHPYLWITAISEIEFGKEIEDPESQTFANLMRSLLHLSRSPIIDRNRIQRRAKKARRRAKNHHKRDVDITCLSLRPTMQPAVTASTVAGNGGSEHHVRRHIARGHWRNQWYPSVAEHRVIWIDEHWRGDADIGLVDGKKVYIARGT